MTAIKIQHYAINKHLLNTDPLFLFPTEGCHINGTGKVAGLFRTIEDAKAGDGHEEAIVLWVNLTPEEQAVATANSEWLANQSN